MVVDSTASLTASMTRARLGARLWQLLWALPLPIWLGLFFILPLLMLIALSFWTVQNFRLTPAASVDAWAYVLGLDYLWGIYWRTYALAFVSALLVSIIAFPASYALAFIVSPRSRLLLLGVAIAPFFTSYLVRVYSWQVFLVDGGVLPGLVSMLGGPGTSWLNTWFALFLGHATLALPVVLVLQTVALSSMDPTLLTASANLGARPRSALLRVVLPAARPGLVLGMLFAFLLSYAEFVSAAYLGGGAFQTLPILVADLVRAGQQWPRAAVVSILMIGTLLTTAFVTVLWAYKEKG
jgi:spermidine/putrescine transport system permease protein